MLKFYKIFLLLLLATSNLFPKIIECQRLQEILPLIEQDTLVVFNINNVLTCASQDAGSTPWAEEHIARIGAENNISKQHATNLFIPFWHEILIATDVELFDPDAEAFVHYLQSSHIKTMALTNRYVEMAYPTHRQLRSVGIDFVKNPPFPEDFFISGTESPAKYIEGIIFNGLLNFKGDSLAAFLKQINYFPKKLIYIEDKPKHLVQVEQTMDSLGIPFIGVHFGALELQRQSYRPELAALQVQFHFDLLDDASARRLYHKQGVKVTPNPEFLVKTTPSLPKNIRKIETIEEIKQDLVPEALIVTELDHVLWRTQGAIGSRSFLDQIEQKYCSTGATLVDARARAERLVEKIHRRAQVRLIEDKSVSFFKGLALQNCWSVAVSFRPMRLLQRTLEQSRSLGLFFNSPFRGDHFVSQEEIICADQPNFQFKKLNENLSSLQVKPSLLIGISSTLSDLLALQEVANLQSLKFLGYYYDPADVEEEFIEDGILALELECLDRLLTNEEAAFLLE